MHIVINRKSVSFLYLPLGEKGLVFSVAQKFSKLVKTITGVSLEIKMISSASECQSGILFARKDDLVKIIPDADIDYSKIHGDGFIVKQIGQLVIVTALTDRGVYFGGHDLIEKNAQIVFSRGLKQEQIDYIKADSIELSTVNYSESSPFAVRAWNLCGIGSEGRPHEDDGTAEFISANKSNGVSHYLKRSWKEFGLFAAGERVDELNNLDDLIKDHPEYFMTAPDGSPMKALEGYDSFLNYYNPWIAKEFGRRLAQQFSKLDSEDVINWVMPDNPYFVMVENGIKLNEQPFTADDGTTVNPSDENYKSTVYFNFLNRAMKEARSINPKVQLSVFAYTYSEVCPAIEIDQNIIVSLAPISTNDKYSYVDETNHDNDRIRDNILAWSKKAKKLGIYTYWNSFRGTIYSRPILKVVKENLTWFKKLGVYQVLVEGKVDCSIAQNLSDAQKNSIKFYDMNEAYVWALSKLMWNPDQDESELLERYCKIVYKESASQMLEYFRLLKKGWDDSESLVWYATGGDVYYLQFIIGAKIDDQMLSVLKKANQLATTPSVKRKTASILETVSREIEKYKNFVKEDACVLYCGDGMQSIISESSLNYINNPGSVWNKAKSLTVLRDYNTLESYPEQAKFNCKMIYDDQNMYIAYTIFDDQIESAKKCDQTLRIYRQDGSEVVSYAETYIGGNTFNRSTYYGYISGFMGERDTKGSFYENKGVPKRIPNPDGVEDVKFVHLSEQKDKRYYVHVQVIPFTALEVSFDTATPYGSFVYYTDRFGRAGWMGYGLWSKQNFSQFNLTDKKS